MIDRHRLHNRQVRHDRTPVLEDLVVGEQLTGRVNHWNPARGYGFVDVDGRRCRGIFCHITKVVTRTDLEVGDRVTFVVGTDRDGRLAAHDVRLIS